MLASPRPGQPPATVNVSLQKISERLTATTTDKDAAEKNEQRPKRKHMASHLEIPKPPAPKPFRLELWTER